jgi:hypothetical protein
MCVCVCVCVCMSHHTMSVSEFITLRVLHDYDARALARFENAMIISRSHSDAYACVSARAKESDDSLPFHLQAEKIQEAQLRVCEVACREVSMSASHAAGGTPNGLPVKALNSIQETCGELSTVVWVHDCIIACMLTYAFIYTNTYICETV